MKHSIPAFAAALALCMAAEVPFAQPPAATAASANRATTGSAAAEFLQKMGSRGVGVHDPSTIVKCKNEYWLFYTGNTSSYHSYDMKVWTPGPRAVTAPLQWVRDAIPGSGGTGFWAPDLIKVKDKYFLFVSSSSFGVNGSAIGVLSNPTLDPDDPAFNWTDGGLIVKSEQKDDFNCIDPGALYDDDGKLWLCFGSFWSGIKLIELNPETGKRIAPDSPMYSLAHWDSIEAAYIYKHDGYYYLFASYGLCCRGMNSSYHTRIGRSKTVAGPYLDKDGKDLLLGGGSIFMDTEGPFIGPGHAGIIEENGKYWVSCHYYDGSANGASKLAIRPLTWDDKGWPVAGKAE